MDKAYIANLLLLAWFWFLVLAIGVKLLYLAVGDYPMSRKSIERWEHVIGLIANTVMIFLVWFALWSN